MLESVLLRFPGPLGARRVKPWTEYRLAMLRNGYRPLLNRCKVPVLQNWPRLAVDEAMVLAWDRSAHLSSGMVFDGDLAAMDVDVPNAAWVAELAAAIGGKFPALFRQGLVRHAGGPKECWVARVDKPFGLLRSRKWYRAGDDPKDPATPTYRVECFSSRRGRIIRQIGVDGPHKRNRFGEVISTYQFNGGASPATVPRASLPILPKAAFGAACDLLDAIAAREGLIAIDETRAGNGRGVVFDLVDTMTFEGADGAYKLDELESEYWRAQYQGRDFRVSSSFLGHGSNSSKCSVGYAKRGRCIFIHDFETELTHMPAGRGPPDMAKVCARLARLNRRAK
jgi:hypothetical protein